MPERAQPERPHLERIQLERIHLEIIREVDRRGSLTAAAERLHLTQSALSHAVRKLEDRAGTLVWQREGRQLKLTQAGRDLLGVANRVVPQLEDAERRLAQFARGERGTLRIGMECHPCYQWLLKLVAPYLAAWPDVDVDVKQRFQFGGLGALFADEIDVLVTPDPLLRSGLRFEPVFDYEQVLVVGRDHRLARRRFVEPRDLSDETLITYPVETDRLDIYTLFMTPAQVGPRRHTVTENTEILLQMVASGRGVAAMPRWLVDEYAGRMPLAAVRLGRSGIAKQIHLGLRDTDALPGYVAAFIELARSTPSPRNRRSSPDPRTLPDPGQARMLSDTA